MFKVSKSLFKQIKTDTIRWQHKNFKGGDRTLPVILKRFNLIPHVTTVGSCEGHPKSNKTGFNIITISLDDNHNYMHHIQERILNKCLSVIKNESTCNKDRKAHIYIMCNLSVKHSVRIAPITPEVNSVWCKFTVLTLNYLGEQSEEVRDIFYKYLRQELKLYLRDNYGILKEHYRLDF